MTWRTDMAMEELRETLDRMGEIAERDHHRNTEAVWFDMGSLIGCAEIARKALAEVEGSVSPTPTTDE